MTLYTITAREGICVTFIAGVGGFEVGSVVVQAGRVDLCELWVENSEAAARVCGAVRVQNPSNFRFAARTLLPDARRAPVGHLSTKHGRMNSNAFVVCACRCEGVFLAEENVFTCAQAKPNKREHQDKHEREQLWWKGRLSSRHERRFCVIEKLISRKSQHTLLPTKQHWLASTRHMSRITWSCHVYRCHAQCCVSELWRIRSLWVELRKLNKTTAQYDALSENAKIWCS